MNYCWQFATLEDGTREGWNDSSITTFKNNRMKNLVREILQNSLDNPDPNQSEFPVTVRFRLRKIERDLIPGMDSLEQALLNIRESTKAEGKENENHLVEINEAIRLAQSSMVNVLEIADFNTTGMPGPCQEGYPFFTYIKTKGSSGGNTNRGGSHGIGKAAPLAVSGLRTLLVSTCFKIEGGSGSLVQGRTTLMSQPKDKGRFSSAIGFLGGENYMPVEIMDKPFDWLNRAKNEIGTTIFVLGFQYGKIDSWQHQIIAYALQNYFAAFERGKLEIVLEDQTKLKSTQITIDQSNFEQYFLNGAINDAFKNSQTRGEEISLDEVREYLDCLKIENETSEKLPEPNDEVSQISKFVNIPDIGKCKINLVVKEGASRKICLIRNNILITDKIPTFRRIPRSLKDFAGLIECVDEEGSKLIRSMEPPEHNALSQDNMPESKQNLGEKALNSLGETLKDLVKEYAKIDVGEGGEVDFLKEFFADIAGDSTDVNEEEDIDPNGVFTLNVLAKKRPRAKTIISNSIEGVPDVADEYSDEGEDGNVGGAKTAQTDKSRPTPGPTHGPQHGDGTGGTGEKSSRSKSTRSITYPTLQRFIRKEPNLFNFVVRTEESGMVSFSFVEVGSDNSEGLRAISSNLGTIENGKLNIETKPNAKQNIEVTFEREIKGGLMARIEV